MANLDRLLKKIEKNKETANETTTHLYKHDGEEFNVRTLSRQEKRDFIYALESKQKSMTAGDIVKVMKPFVYKSIEELAPLAVKAKEAGYITKNQDVVEELFDTMEILEIIAFITEINDLGKETPEEEIEELKKQ